MIKQILKVKSGICEIIWHDSVDFSKIKPITQIYGVCFTKNGRMCIVKNSDNHWTLPGGTPEKNETPKQTLKREVNEEADINIKNIMPLGYQSSYDIKTKKKIYQLRYTAIISKIKKQTIDPAENIIPERKFIKPEDFIKYTKWGNTGKAMLDKVAELFENQK